MIRCLLPSFYRRMIGWKILRRRKMSCADLKRANRSPHLQRRSSAVGWSTSNWELAGGNKKTHRAQYDSTGSGGKNMSCLPVIKSFTVLRTGILWCEQGSGAVPAGTLDMLDSDGYKKWFNVKKTHTDFVIPSHTSSKRGNMPFHARCSSQQRRY